jgi:nucleoside-diphosphate-sugar epimerase/CBS domain-containing protein
MYRKNKKLNHLLIDKESTIKEAMGMIDKNGLGVVFVIEEKGKLFGLVTDGDIRRAILTGIDINKTTEKITNRNPIVIKENNLEKEIKEIRTRKGVMEKIPLRGSLKVPVVDQGGRVKDIIFISDIIPGPKLDYAGGSVKKVLLIGGAGYLGSVLARKLLDCGYKVKVFDNLTYGDEGIKGLYQNNDFEFLKGDIRNLSELVEAIRGVDAVIHLAAIVGDPACAKEPRKTLEINYLATKNIVEVCKYFQVNRLVFASTCSVYGQSVNTNEKLDERSILNPVSLYAETKIKCEQSILNSVEDNFSPTIIRMATLYGYSPNMRFDLAVNFLTAKALFDKKITIFGGNQWRPWLHLDDASLAFIFCLKAPIGKIRGEIFNVLSENYKVIKIGKIIKSICPDSEIYIDKKISDKRDYNVSCNKIIRVLGYKPGKKITDGIREIKEAIQKSLIKDYNDPKYRVSLPQI